MSDEAERGVPHALPTLLDTPFQEERADMLKRLLPRRSIGAELGVFRGEFSATIIRAIQPRELHLVDPWEVAYGANYPNWGDYTERGALTTSLAYAETVSRTHSAGDIKVVIVKDYSLTWLPTTPDAYFDWIYIDSTHTYEDTSRELTICARKVKADGIICGHDFAIGRHEYHHGVFRAVTEFVRKGEFELIWAGPQQQWAVRRSEAPASPETAEPQSS
jgi:Methyltransferase domain